MIEQIARRWCEQPDVSYPDSCAIGLQVRKLPENRLTVLLMTCNSLTTTENASVFQL